MIMIIDNEEDTTSKEMTNTDQGLQCPSWIFANRELDERAEPVDDSVCKIALAQAIDFIFTTALFLSVFVLTGVLTCLIAR